MKLSQKEIEAALQACRAALRYQPKNVELASVINKLECSQVEDLDTSVMKLPPGW